MYAISLPFGVGYLNSASILGGEELTKDALAALGISSDGKSVTMNDVTADVSSAAGPKRVKAPGEVFYGTQMCYCFMRLYHTLFTRLAKAKELAAEASERVSYT